MEGIPFFMGYEHFSCVVVDEKLSCPGRIIKAYNHMKSSSEEDIYIIGSENQLFSAQTGKRVEPKDVLNLAVAPNGWGVEGIAQEDLPDEERRKISSSS